MNKKQLIYKRPVYSLIFVVPTSATNEYNTSATTPPNDSEVMTIGQQEGLTYVLTNTPGREGVPEEMHPHHHDSDQWMAVSFLLIGSLITTSIFGFLFYLRTRR